MSGHLLSVVIFLPLLGVAALVVSGRELGDTTSRWLTLFVTVVTFLVSLAVFARSSRAGSSAPSWRAASVAVQVRISPCRRSIPTWFL